MLLVPGDLAYADAQQPLWDSFGRFVQRHASRRPWMVTHGNHEVEAPPLPPVPGAPPPFAAYGARWPAPHEESGSPSNLYYSFDAAGGAVHVVMLGSYAPFGAGSDQHRWLARDLAGVDRRATPWVVTRSSGRNAMRASSMRRPFRPSIVTAPSSVSMGVTGR